MHLSPTLRYVGMDDVQTRLFENQWPLPSGVTYNSWLVIGRQVALVDTAAAAFSEPFFAQIRAELGERPIDYLIVNHMEPDHSALIAQVRAAWPGIRILASAKAIPMIAGYQGITDNVQAVGEGDLLDLGGVTLRFFMTPMVHWPETMMTWLEEEGILFSGDAFGCFGKVGRIDSGLFADYEEEMIRYYACIVGKYGATVQAALRKLSALPVQAICPTHGPMWTRERADVIRCYDRLSRYEGERGVCLAYGSMYGNTASAAQALADELRRRNVPVAVHDLCNENVSDAYKDVFKYDTLIVGSPTYNNEIFPAVWAFMQGLASRMVKNRRFAAFGSYTWAGASVRLLNEMADQLKWRRIHDGISFAQGYTEDKFPAAALADAVVQA